MNRFMELLFMCNGCLTIQARYFTIKSVYRFVVMEAVFWGYLGIATAIRPSWMRPPRR
jgi:hypothetical protein